MNKSRSMQPSRIIRRAALAVLVAGGSLGTGLVHAGDTGHGPVYKTLDTLAGGIETIFRLGDQGKARCDENCDDGCDHVMLQELSNPVDLNQIYLAPAAPAPLHSVPQHSAPLPPADIQPPAARQSPQRQSAPDLPPPIQRPVQPPAVEAVRRPRPEPPERLRRDLPQPLIRQPISKPAESAGKWFQDRGLAPAPVQDWSQPRRQAPAARPPALKAPSSKGGFFDELSDPFVDDSASLLPKAGLFRDEGVLQAVRVESLQALRSIPSPVAKRQPSTLRRVNKSTVRQVSGQLELPPLKLVD